MSWGHKGIEAEQAYIAGSAKNSLRSSLIREEHKEMILFKVLKIGPEPSAREGQEEEKEAQSYLTTKLRGHH